MRARQMECVEANLQEEIEHALAARRRHGAAERKQSFCGLSPTHARRVPPPGVRALLEPGRGRFCARISSTRPIRSFSFRTRGSTP